MSHYLTQPEEIDYFWMIEGYDMESAASHTEGALTGAGARNAMNDDVLRSSNEAAA